MRITTIGLNVLLLLYVLYLLIAKGPPGKHETFLLPLLFAVPILSIIGLFLGGGESWLKLHFERKVLEEKKKIKELKNAEEE